MKTVPANRGNALVFALMMVTVLALLMKNYGTSVISGYKSSKKIAAGAELGRLRELMAEHVNCEQSLQAAGINLMTANNCTSTTTTQAAPYFRLRRKSLNNTVQWFTDPLDADNAATIGEWRIRTSCSQQDQSVIVHALPARGASVADPPPNDWTQARLVFGKADGIPKLCSEQIPALNNLSWHNKNCRWDTNNDGWVTAIDSLVIINILNTAGAHALRNDATADAVSGNHPVPGNFIDVDNNLSVEAQDGNIIIDYLNNIGAGVCPGSRSDASLSWHNSKCRWDVSNDGNIAPNDVLIIVNLINAQGAHPLDPDLTDPVAGIHPLPGNFIDVDNNRWVNNQDSTQVTNYLNANGPGPCP